MLTFRKRICAKEVFPLLIDELLAWETELHDGGGDQFPASTSTGAAILFQWKTTFWPLFRIQSHLEGFLAGVNAYLYGRLPTVKVHESAARLIELSLFHLGVLLRFANDPVFSELHIDTQHPEVTIEGQQDDLQQLFLFLRSRLSFSPADQLWLDGAIDRETERPLDEFFASVGQQSPDHFRDFLAGDPRGVRVFKRFIITLEECACDLQAGGLRAPWHDIASCPIHAIEVQTKELERRLERRWLFAARARGAMYVGGIPPRNTEKRMTST